MRLAALGLLILLQAPLVFSQAVDSSKLVPVEFQFTRVLQSAEIGVGLNGSFNNWGGDNNKHPIPMTNVGDDLWNVTVLLSPGVWPYKFVTFLAGSANDTIISSWITDPNNPQVDGTSYNNSILRVSDPMIYYLFPMNGSTINNRTPEISAKVSWAQGSDIDVASIGLKVDNVSVPNGSSYFDRSVRVFNYTPSTPLTFEQHSVELSVANNKAVIATLTSTFSVVNQIISAPYTFVFDPLSPNFKQVGAIRTVEIKGTFNKFGSDPLVGPDSDGVYTRTVQLNIGTPNSYQFIINGGQYIDDPDNPMMQKDFGTIVVKRVEPNPKFKFIQPRQGQLVPPGLNLNVKAELLMSDSGFAINRGSIQIFLDGTPIAVASADSGADGVTVTTASFAPMQGRHQLKFVGADVEGNRTEAYLTFGAFAAGTSFHYVDADSDDNGPGGYMYPDFSPVGSADIREIDILANTSNDSLVFSVSMGSVTDYTRVGFEIVSSLDGQRILGPDNISIQLPDFTNRGVFFVIAAPNSGQLSGIEDKLFTDTQLRSLTPRPVIIVNSDAKSAGVFQFRLPLNVLESAMGSFSKGWYFIAYSYLGDSGGGWKVPQSDGGSVFPESPNIYDAAFFFNTSIEKRDLSNYNYSFNYGGSRYALLASNQRGALFIKPSDISTSLASKPFVKILTDGGELRESDTVRVCVYVSDSTRSTCLLSLNGTSSAASLVRDTAVFTAVLAEGTNELQAAADYGTGLRSCSTKVFFSRIKNHKPTISFAEHVAGGAVTLDASGTTNPDNLPESFSWTQDKANPSSVTLSSTSSPTISFSVPSVKGEYYFTLTCSTSKDNASQRAVLTVDSAGASLPDISYWHPSWVDSAIVYEVYVKTMSLDGDLPAVTRRIPMMKDLGINTIWLMPIHPGPQMSPSQPGYAITNYFDVNPSYGTKADLKALVDSAHANGIRVILDYVVNHTHNTHPFLLDASKYGPASPYRNFYYWNPDGSYQYLYTWTDLPSINYDYQQNMDYLIDVAKYWLQTFSIDGYRCDVASGVNDTRPNGPAFWQRFRRELKTIKPDVFLLGELDASVLNYFDKKFDSGYDWWLLTSMKDALSNHTLIHELDSALAYYSSPSYPGYVRPFRFMENHDESRLISLFPVEKVKLAATLLLTLPGVPMIYAGQEAGEQTFRGLIDWSDPDDLRPFYKRLISLRRSFSSLSVGKYSRALTSSPDSVFAYARVADSLSAFVAHNFTGGSVTFSTSIDTSAFRIKGGVTYYFNDVLNGTYYQITSSSARNLKLTLPPNSSAVLILARTPFVTSVQGQPQVPISFSLEQNYPNPFNPTTTIQFSLAGNGSLLVKLEVYNIMGQKVKTILDESRAPGFYRVLWDGRNDFGRQVASGMYFYKLQSRDFVQTKKMILLK
jgi:cyclomaltodextrinase